MSSHRTWLTEELIEGTTPVVSFQIIDADGVGFKPTTLTLTLYAERNGAIINSRSQQNVLDTNGVTVDSDGNAVWQVTALDLPILKTNAGEAHIALFEWTWNAGQRSGKHEIAHIVRNLAKVA